VAALFAASSSSQSVAHCERRWSMELDRQDNTQLVPWAAPFSAGAGHVVYFDLPALYARWPGKE